MMNKWRRCAKSSMGDPSFDDDDDGDADDDDDGGDDDDC